MFHLILRRLRTDNKLRNIINKERKRKCYSQIYLSNLLYISQKTYSRIESGHVEISLKIFLKLLYILELNPLEILKEIVQGKSSWDKINIREEILTEENIKLKREINQLNEYIQQLILQNNKLLEKPCCLK
ncbi:MAG TPA: helix-turn-helix transcriptional regulator [Lentimicrobium sp.]|nr:helix-turn-helix transcriptional regulator [Lentimicrobium sp.]